MAFLDRLIAAERQNQSLLCIGLDPEPSRLPAAVQGADDPLYAFCAAIIEATSDLVCAFKPNIAFFEAYGPAGLETLKRVMQAVPRDIPVILDAKRGDIDSTAAAYARACFDVFQADAVTLSPYLGSDALRPFLNYPEKGCFILCKTSNPGSAELQNLTLANGQPLYLEVARLAQEKWNTHGNVGLVVGATYPDEVQAVRALCPELPLLVPGIGTQGGSLDIVAAAVDAQGERALINASRSVTYASNGADFAEAARAEALRLRESFRATLAVAL